MTSRTVRRLVLFFAATVLAALLGPASGAEPAPTADMAVAPSATSAIATETDVARPLVIVLDTSSSMSEEDGAGTIKLAGAQAALSRVVREQRPGTRIGLWTYPDGSCEPGGFRIPVQPLDQRGMISRIRSLTADGDTPTGEALRAAVDDLQANGYAGATLLLISDGLHTCDADPCVVAEEVVAEGFDLTVQAAGFQIDEQGEQELACIAGATGGQVFNAQDSEELAAGIAEVTRAELTLDVTGLPTKVPAGAAARVEVTVSNASAVDVAAPRVSFSFGGTFNDGVVPAVLPPLVRFGNLRAGESDTYRWVVSFGSRGKTGTAAYRIAAWGSNAQPRTVSGAVEVTDEQLDLDDAGGYIAGLRGERIAILGDSYSSGEGAGDYLSGTDQNKWQGKNRCHKSPHTYLYPLFDADDVELIACSGATTHHIGDDPASGVREEQVPLLRERQRDGGPVAAAFMTVGGNDITFADIIAACLKWGDCSDDDAFTDEKQRLVDGLGPELLATYRDVYETLNDDDAVGERGHLAPLYVLPYPQPFPERQWAGSFCRGFEADEIAWANNFVDALNARIETTVGQARRRGYHVRFVSTVQEALLPDNTACPRPGSKAFLNPVDLQSGIEGKIDYEVYGISHVQEYMHPNADGYRAETNVILAWSVDEDESLPRGVEEWRPRPAGFLDLDLSGIARVLTPSLPAHGPVTFDATTGRFASSRSDVRAGQAVEMQVDNAMPGSTVTVAMASRRQVVGLLVAGDDGVARGRVRIPADAPIGAHHLTVLAVDREGRSIVRSQDLDVARQVPWWLAPLMALTVACFGGWLWCRRRLRGRSPAD